MATIKVFDCHGVKTVEMLGNVNEQDYDPILDVEEDAADQDTAAAEE